MKDRIREVVQNSGFWIIVSLVTTIISIFRPVFDVDNMANVYITNGLYQSTAQTWNIYSGILLCYIIGKLHSIFVHINIYTVINWLMMIQQTFTFNYYISRNVKRSKAKLLIYTIEIFVFGGLLQILNMNYIIQQALSMCTQIVCIDEFNRAKHKKPLWMLAQIVYCIYGMQLRVKQGILVIPWIGLVSLLLSINNNKISIKRLAINLLPLILALIQLCPDIVLINSNTEYREQYLYDKYRAYFFDYDHGVDDYVQVQQRDSVLDSENGIDLDQLKKAVDKHPTNHRVKTFIINSIHGLGDTHQLVNLALLILLLSIKVYVNDRACKIMMGLNNFGTLIVATYFQLCGRFFNGLDRVYVCITLAYIVTRLIVISHADGRVQFSYNKNIITVALCGLVSYSIMQQAYLNLTSSSGVQTYKQLYIDSVEYDDSNIVYGITKQMEKRAGLINDGKFIIFKQLGQTEQSMMQYRQSEVYKDKIVSKLFQGEYMLIIEDYNDEVLDILTARYISIYPDDPVIEFKMLENSEGEAYYVAEKQVDKD